MTNTETSKRVSDSETSQVQILNQSHLNGYDRLFGGQLMSWMDIVAAVSARRHSGKNVTTVRVDGLEFHLPAHANNIMSIHAHVAYVGSTSMYVRVEAYVEKLDGSRELTNRAWFIMVALDENEKPVRVPGIIPETESEKAEWEEARQLKLSLKKA